MNRFEWWVYNHLVPKRTRNRTEAQIASVAALTRSCLCNCFECTVGHHRSCRYRHKCIRRPNQERA